MPAMTEEDDRLRGKLFRIGRSAAFAVGGGLGLWFVGFLFPESSERADRLRSLVPLLSGWAIVYGVTVLASLLIRPKAAPAINAGLVWIVTPGILLYGLMSALK
jgi:hypothetical protein